MEQEVATLKQGIIQSLNIQEKSQIKNNKGINDDLLLGELLGYLRINKLMSALMVCRQISKIDVEDKIATIYADGHEDEFINNEQIALEIKKYFETKGLSYKIYKKEKDRNPIEELNKLLGGKLKIE